MRFFDSFACFGFEEVYDEEDVIILQPLGHAESRNTPREAGVWHDVSALLEILQNVCHPQAPLKHWDSPLQFLGRCNFSDSSAAKTTPSAWFIADYRNSPPYEHIRLVLLSRSLHRL
jgi:hypothetical protein